MKQSDDNSTALYEKIVFGFWLATFGLNRIFHLFVCSENFLITSLIILTDNDGSWTVKNKEVLLAKNLERD